MPSLEYLQFHDLSHRRVAYRKKILWQVLIFNNFEFVDAFDSACITHDSDDEDDYFSVQNLKWGSIRVMEYSFEEFGIKKTITDTKQFLRLHDRLSNRKDAQGFDLGTAVRL